MKMLITASGTTGTHNKSSTNRHKRLETSLHKKKRWDAFFRQEIHTRMSTSYLFVGYHRISQLYNNFKNYRQEESLSVNLCTWTIHRDVEVAGN